jgi:Ring finger domain
MQSFAETMASMGYTKEVIAILSQKTSDPAVALDIIESKQEAVNTIKECIGNEDCALELALLHQTPHEALENFFKTIKAKPRVNTHPKNRLNIFQYSEANRINRTYDDFRDPPVLNTRIMNKNRATVPSYNFANEPLEVYQRTSLINLTDIRMDSQESIYLGAPGTVIEGKEVNSLDRDDMISYVMDEYGKKPLAQNKRSNLKPTKVYDTRLLKELCSICQFNYQINEDIYTLPCGHFFHKECIEQNFKYSSRCPIDNNPL